MEGVRGVRSRGTIKREQRANRGYARTDTGAESTKSIWNEETGKAHLKLELERRFIQTIGVTGNFRSY